MFSLEEVSKLRGRLTIPLVAIGGITKENVAQVMAESASAVAVVSAILEADDIEKATRQLVRALKVKR